MRVVVDTCVWSLFLRRRPQVLSGVERRLISVMRELIADGRAIIVGVVRQELLSGLREERAVDEMADYLRFFDDDPPDVADYEQAARFANRCRSAGITTSSTDMLLCSFAEGRGLHLLTTDRDFHHYAKHVPVQLYPDP